MPSVHQTRFAPGRQRLQGTFGVPATYTAPDATVITGFLARKRANDSVVTVAGGRTVQTQGCDILVDIVDVPYPVKGGRFNLEGEVWTIEHDPKTANGGHVCTCTRAKAEKRGERRLNSNA